MIQVFNNKEIPEWLLRRMLNKLESQIERVESGKTQIKEAYETKLAPDVLQKALVSMVGLFAEKRDSKFERYYKARTRSIILEKVLERFEILHSIPSIENSQALADIEALYKKLLDAARTTRKELYTLPEIKELEKNIVSDMLQTQKCEIIELLYNAGLISHKSATSIHDQYIQ